MKILNLNGTVTPSEVFRLQLWFDKLLAEDFDKWIRDFHIVKWTEKLSNLSLSDLAEGFKNFQIYRNTILSSNVLPFPINCHVFKNFCYGLSINSDFDKWRKIILFESLEKIKNNDFFYCNKSDAKNCNCKFCKNSK